MFEIYLPGKKSLDKNLRCTTSGEAILDSIHLKVERNKNKTRPKFQKKEFPLV